MAAELKVSLFFILRGLETRATNKILQYVVSMSDSGPSQSLHIIKHRWMGQKSMISVVEKVLLSVHHILLLSLKAFFTNEVIPLFHLAHGMSQPIKRFCLCITHWMTWNLARIQENKISLQHSSYIVYTVIFLTALPSFSMRAWPYDMVLWLEVCFYRVLGPTNALSSIICLIPVH